MVVGRRYLYHVHRGQLHGAHHLADGAEQLARQHPTRLRRACTGRETWIEDVDVDGQVDGLRSVERLRDRIGHHGLRAA